MKLSQFMPLYGGDFFQAVAGYPDSVAIAYLRAIWHYWAHTACEGLPDDPEYLRRVCCIETAEWVAVKEIVFDDRYHFKRTAGRWHSKRAMAEYQKAKQVAMARSLGGRKAMSKRWAATGGHDNSAMTGDN